MSVEAVQVVISSGLSLHDYKGFTGTMRLRYFGPRDLKSDGVNRSDATLLINAGAGYKIGERWRISADVLNLLNRRNDDITYAYVSRITPTATRHSPTFSTPPNRKEYGDGRRRERGRKRSAHRLLVSLAKCPLIRTCRGGPRSSRREHCSFGKCHVDSSQDRWPHPRMHHLDDAISPSRRASRNDAEYRNRRRQS
jgi:hypothetical protein